MSQINRFQELITIRNTFYKQRKSIVLAEFLGGFFKFKERYDIHKEKFPNKTRTFWGTIFKQKIIIIFYIKTMALQGTIWDTIWATKLGTFFNLYTRYTLLQRIISDKIPTKSRQKRGQKRGNFFKRKTINIFHKDTFYQQIFTKQE